MPQKNAFHFMNKGSKFDRIFSIFFFKSLIIDLATGCDLSQDLQLPTYQGQFLSISQKLTKKEIAKSIEFLAKFKSATKDKLEAQKLLQNHFRLTDCDVSF